MELNFIVVEIHLQGDKVDISIRPSWDSCYRREFSITVSKNDLLKLIEDFKKLVELLEKLLK